MTLSGMTLPGPPAIPRDGDGPAFSAPWEARAFAVVAALAESGRITWPDFQASLIAEIEAAGEDPAADYDSATYYRHWLAAAERLLAKRALLAQEDVTERIAALTASRPA